VHCPNTAVSKTEFWKHVFQQMSLLPPLPPSLGDVTDLSSSATNQRSASPTGSAVMATRTARMARMRPTAVSSQRPCPLEACLASRQPDPGVALLLWSCPHLCVWGLGRASK
jgi:hypothetical protein